MAKRLKQQRRGKGSPKYRATKHSIKARYAVSYNDSCNAEIVDIIHNRGKTAPLAKVLTDSGKEFFIPAVEGSYVSQRLQIGKDAKLSLGNIMPLANVSPGTFVSNIEARPNDGGSILRASGAYGIVIAKDEKGVYVKLRSRVKKLFNPNSLCTVGRVAGGSRKEKPLYKAGNNYYLQKSKGGRIYPVVRGTAMNAVDHPHGGSGHNSPGRRKNRSRKFSAPGQKVGAVAAKRTGRRKR